VNTSKIEMKFLKLLALKPSRQVAKSVTSPLLDSAMGFVFGGF